MEQHIIKSLNDTRDYRAIQLENGLNALLISDLHRLEAATNEDNASMDEGSSGSEDEGTDDDDDDDDSEMESDDATEMGIPKPKGKARRAAVKKKTRDVKLSAASLCVNVGSFCDPPDIPGLAHFLEHMVFMGSEKYPNENDFDSFVKKLGGNSNAYTDTEKTVFYFDIQRKHFRKGLDMFAQFFIKPLMLKDSIDREIEAVNSEFDMNLPSDPHRKEQLLCMMAKPGHPMNKFMWGNTHTLKTMPQEQGIDLDSRLRQFQQRMYSAHYITLAVQATETLDTLQEWVTDIFSLVPNNGLDKPKFAHAGNPFDTPDFYMLYKVVPMSNIHEIIITWSMPSQLANYRVKPLSYIGWLLGHESEGSVLSYLKKNLWAVGLTSGNSETGFEHNSTWASFSVCVVLTEMGFQHVLEVITAVFEYMKMLRELGPQERIYSEIKRIEDNEFRWQEQIDAVEYVEALCESMQLYPVAHYLTGDSLYMQYDQKVIKQCQDLLLPRKANIMLVTKAYAEDVDMKKEKWFQTLYSANDTPTEWQQRWDNLEVSDKFHLPAKNEYIAMDFSLKELGEIHAHPVVITDSSQSRLWYKQDTKFKVPKAYANFILINPILNSTALSACLFDLFIKVLSHNLAEVTYAADAAQLNYTVKGHERGLLIRVSGFNDKLTKLFETIIEHIANFTVTNETFEAIKHELHKKYYNTYLNPSQLVVELRLSLLQHNLWTSVEKQQLMSTISCDMLTSFVKQATCKVFVEGLVQGNISVKEAHSMESFLLDKLNCEILPKSLFPTVRVLALPVGQSYCRVDTFNKEDSNSVITNYYQHGAATLREYTLNELLVMRMEEPCFDILRTREQLGYAVFCTNRNTFGILGLSVTVCSQANKFDMNILDKHIEKFLEEFQQMLSSMTKADFQILVAALVTLKRCEDTHLGEEMDRNWVEVIMQTYNFDYLNKQIDIAESLTLNDFQHWFHTYQKCKKLSVQVMGSQQTRSTIKGESSFPDSTSTSHPRLHFHPVTSCYVSPDQPHKLHQIDDLHKFHNQYPLYPASKIC